MSNRLRLTTIFCAVLGVSGMLAACDDSDDAVPNGDERGGAAGESPGVGGKQTGGSSSGSAGKAGSAGSGTAGKAGGAGAGGADMAGAGGVGGAGGEPAIGGAGGAGGESGEGGAGGAGGSGPELEYLCGASNLSEKLCSALVSVTCEEPTLCVECVPAREADLELFAECATCLALHEASYQCGIDAYESGNTAAGIECYGFADLNDACFESFNQALACNDHKNKYGCPATWPAP